MTPRRRLALAAVAGAIAGLGHAPFDLWFLAIPAFTVIAYLMHFAETARQGAVLGWAAGAGYFAVTLHWIVEPFLVDAATHGWMAPGAVVLLSGGLALFWAAAGWGTVKLGTSRWLAWALLLSAA